MHHRVTRIAAFLAFVTLLSQGQTNTITIRHIGNCGMQLTDGTKNIYVDFPYKPGTYGYMAYAASGLDSVPAGSTFIFTRISGQLCIELCTTFWYSA